MSETKKTCLKCKKEKLTVDFYSQKNAAGQFSLRTICKVCVRNSYSESKMAGNELTNIAKFIIEAYKLRDVKRLKRYIIAAENFIYNKTTLDSTSSTYVSVGTFEI